MISTLLVISGSPGITRNDEIDHDHWPFLGFGGSRDSWKGPRPCMISIFLVISGSPGITRNDEIDHDHGPFLGFGGSLDPPNPRKGTCFLNPELGNRRSLLQSRKSHFRKSDATGRTALAFLGSSVFSGFQPRTLRL